jgi:hypothetical protein
MTRSVLAKARAVSESNGPSPRSVIVTYCDDEGGSEQADPGEGL